MSKSSKTSKKTHRKFVNCNFQSIFGLSALAVEAYGFTLVRPSVTPYLEIRASDFDDFLHKATS